MLSAEGAGPIAVAAGRYSGQHGGTSFDALLAGHAGDAIRIDRISREPDRIDRPAFTVGIACQLDVLRQLASIPGARGTGLLARFVYSFPRSLVGRRDVRAPSMPAEVVQAWGDCLRRILDASRGLTSRATLEFDDDALELLLRFAERVEPRLGPGGDLRPIGDWAGKEVGAVVRVSGMFAVVDAVTLPAKTVTASHVAAAIELAPWLEAQARAAYAAGVADEALAHAVEVLEHLRAVREPISARDLQRALKGRSWLRRAADLEAPLRRLVEAGWIRVSQPPSNGGRRPSPLITVRPEDTPRPTGATTTNSAWSRIQAVLDTRDPSTAALQAQAIRCDPSGTRQHDLRCFLEFVGAALFATSNGLEIYGDPEPEHRRLLDALVREEPSLAREVAHPMPVSLAEVLASAHQH
jgi:hypothetical protein